MYLRQDMMTVTEYVAKFNELAHFALSIVQTNEACTGKFMLGLKVDPETFADAVQWALRNKSWDRGEPRMAPIREKRAVVQVIQSFNWKLT